MRNFTKETSGKNFGDDTLKFDGMQGNGKFSIGMMYELFSRARDQFDIGLADGFGFNPESGEFWVSRGSDSVQNKQYFDMLEASWAMLESKDFQIRKMESDMSQVDSDDEDLSTVASWQEVLNFRKELDTLR